MAKSRIRNSLYNIITGLIGQLIAIVTGFVVRTVFIKTLGDTYLGVSGLFGNILTILSFAELGIGQAIVFSLYKPIAEHDENKICALMNLYERVYKILFVLVLTLGLLILPILPLIIEDYYSIPHLSLIYVMYVFNSAASYLFVYKSTFLIANQQNYIITMVSYIVNLSVAVIQIVCLVVFHQYLLYLAIQISTGILQNIYMAHRVNRMYPFLKNKRNTTLDSSELSNIKKNVGALVIYKIGTLSLNSTDNIIISKFAGIISVGLYSNYTLIVSSVTGFLSTVFSSLTASIGNMNAKESTEKQYFMFRVINLATFWMYSFVSICIFVLANPFISSCWIGSDYLLGIGDVFIISLNVYIGGMLFAPFNYRQTMGLFVQGKIRPIISAVENIVVSVILAKYMGLAGVLWGTAITRLTTNGWYDPYIVYKKMGINPIKYILDYIAKAALMFAVGAFCVAISRLIVINGIFTWMLCGVVLTLVINFVYLAIFCKTDEFKYLYSVVTRIVDNVIVRLRKKN